MNRLLIRHEKALLALGALCLGTLALPAHGASFDCAKASTKVEHLICDNPELSGLDGQMAIQFKSARQCGANSAELVRTQREWLSRRDRCTDVRCIENAYFERLLVFAKMSCEAKGAPPNREGSQAATAAAAVPENTASEQEKIRQIMTSHRFSLSLARDKSEESFCKAFLDDFTAMRSITFLKQEIESDSYADKRWDVYKARCPNADLFEAFDCDPKAQEYVDSLPEEDRRAEEMDSCRLFRCTQKFRLFKVAGKGYTGTHFDAFYCEHMRGPLNFGYTDREEGGGYLFIDPQQCSSNSWVPTTDPYNYRSHIPLENHNGIIIYQGQYFVFDLSVLDVASRGSVGDYTLSLWGGLGFKPNIRIPELEPPTMSPICTFTTTASHIKNK